jgi:hypothetical protein
MAVLLIFSLQLQMNVNALPFFIYFDMLSGFSHLNDPAIDDYFANRPFGLFNADLLAYKKGRPWVPYELAKPRLSPEALARATAYIQAKTYSNYYWWP